MKKRVIGRIKNLRIVNSKNYATNHELYEDSGNLKWGSSDNIYLTKSSAKGRIGTLDSKILVTNINEQVTKNMISVAGDGSLLRRKSGTLTDTNSMFPPDNLIWYTFSEGTLIDVSPSFILNTVISNEYINGKGIITFDKPVTSIGCTNTNTLDDGIIYGLFANYKGLNIDKLGLPGSIEHLYDGAFAHTNLSKVYFNGTVSQWNNIVKESQWRILGNPHADITCTDGTAPIE